MGRTRDVVPWWSWLSYAALMAWAAVRWDSGLSPPALGQDDLWVAFVIKYATSGDLLIYEAPIPMGFVAAQQLVSPWFSNAQLSMQIVPFLCGLAVIPLAGWATSQITRRWELGLVAGALVMLIPELGLFSVRVKQFTWDAAAMLALLAIGAPHLDPDEPDRPERLSFAAAVILLFSFNTIFLGVVLCHVRVLMSAYHRQSLRRAVLAALAYDLFALALYTFRLDAQSADWIVHYWQKWYGFPPQAPSWENGLQLDWARRAAGRAYLTWLPRPLRAWTVLAPVGLATLFLARRTRWLGLALTGGAAALLVAALLLLYPHGGGRTDFFFKPMLAVLSAVAFGTATRWVGSALERLGLGAARARTATILVALVTTGLLFLERPKGPVIYGTGKMTTLYRQLVSKMDSMAGPDDLILISRASRWNVGYYTALPIDADFATPVGRLFDFHATSPDLRVVTDITRDLEDDARERIVFVGLLEGQPRLRSFRRAFRAAGYKMGVRHVDEDRASGVFEFIRVDGRSPTPRAMTQP